MKILYLSCHTVLAYDEVRLLREIGHQVMCPDSFVEKLNPGDDSIRPQIEVPADQLDWYRENMRLYHACGIPGKDNKENLSVEFLKRFDAVIVMHLPIWVTANFQRFQQAGVRVILREIGQSWQRNEEELAACAKAGMKIVRYSLREELIPNKNHSDALIRFYKDPAEFKGWTGEQAKVVSFAQSIIKRKQPCNFDWLEKITRPFPRELYGAESESLDWGKGKVSFDRLKATMQESRVYVNSGTYPASYTLGFIEALMTGIPVVSVGPEMGHPYPWFGRNHPLYEIGDMLNGENGLCSDDFGATQDFIKQLLADQIFAKKIGDAGRATAIELFGKEKISGLWKDFLATV